MNAKKTFCILIGLILVLSVFSAAAMAGSARGSVKGVIVHRPGVIMFDIDGGRWSKPSCSTAGYGKSFAVSLNTAWGKSMLALLLSAANLNAEVYVHGNGKCDVWGDRESVLYIYMEP